MRVRRPRSEAAQARQAVTPILPTRNRTGPPTQTGLVAVKRAGGAWLGCHFQHGRARTSGTLSPRMWLGQPAMHARRRHLREPTERRGLRGTLAALVANLNRLMRGWRNDVRVGHSTQTFQDLERSGRQRLGHGLRARVKRGTAPEPLQALYRPRGLAYFSARGRGGTRP